MGLYFAYLSKRGNSYPILSLGSLMLPYSWLHAVGHFISEAGQEIFQWFPRQLPHFPSAFYWPLALFVVAKCLKKAFLKSGQLLMLPVGSLVHQTYVVSLRVRWKALNFMAEVASLKLMWVLKLLRCFAGFLLPS